MKTLLTQIQDYRHAPQDHYQGHVDERFIDLAMLFSRLQAARADRGGAALTVYFQGQNVIDIYTGQQSENEKWQDNTLSVCYSTGKGVLATLAHILVSEGFLDYDTPVAHYWPEFAQHGKENISLAHMLSHQSGLYDIRHMIDDAREMLDWQHMLHKIASARPRFQLGEDAAYQPLSFGWQVGGVLEKATGQPLQDLMQNYLVDALELDGAYFGVPEHALSRVARPIKIQSTAQEKNITKHQKSVKRKPSVIDKLMEFSGQNPQDFQDAMIPKGMKNISFFSDEGLKAIIPAANGVFTSKSLAKIYAMLSQHGIWQDQQLIRPEAFERLSQIQYRHRDRVMPLPMYWRLGFHRVLSLGKSSNGFGHIGFNGSGAWCDPARELSFAYTHNFNVASITGDYRLWSLTQETLRCADAIRHGRKGWF